MADRNTLEDLGSQEEARERTRRRNREITRLMQAKTCNEKYLRMACKDCQAFSEPYMLTREIWLSIHPSGAKGMLCLDCAETRLGRPLVLSDFSSAVVNLPILVGYGMGIAARGETNA